MLNLPLSWRYLLGPLLLIILCSVLFLLEPQTSHYLAFDRMQIQQFQWWRLVTGNLLHTNTNHLLLNLTAVALLWALHGQYFTLANYTLMFFVLCISTTLLIYGFAEQLQWYVGLSGVLHGVFLIGAYFDIKQGMKTGWLLLLGVLVKVGHEQIFGASQDIADLINATVAIDAHLFGTLSGLVIILILYGKLRLTDGLKEKRSQ
jgi:rhomboid family GlyGly-CTERM serine protease